MMEKHKRLDTNLESAGAEFLVLGQLLIQKIPAYKTYQNFPGYDLVAVNPELNTSVKIQVKSRYRTDYDGFPIKNYDCDFVVFVALNRGFYKAKKSGDSGIKIPDYYIFPILFVHKFRNEKSSWGKINFRNMTGYEEFQDRWDLISAFLNKNEH